MYVVFLLLHLIVLSVNLNPLPAYVSNTSGYRLFSMMDILTILTSFYHRTLSFLSHPVLILLHIHTLLHTASIQSSSFTHTWFLHNLSHFKIRLSICDCWTIHWPQFHHNYVLPTSNHPCKTSPIRCSFRSTFSHHHNWSLLLTPTLLQNRICFIIYLRPNLSPGTINYSTH